MENRIAYCIPTYNHPNTIKEVIGMAADMYDRNGFDIYIYDTSEMDTTQKIIEKYRENGISNVYYIRWKADISAYEKILDILLGKDLKKEYDYLGIIKDRTFFHEHTMAKIQEESKKGFDDVFVPIGHWSLDVMPQPEKLVYKDPVDFFRDYGAYITDLETVFFNRKTLLKQIDREKFMKKYFTGRECAFEQMTLLFEKLACLPAVKIRVLRETESIRYVSKKSSSMWQKSVFHIWSNLWPKAVDRLPECYNPHKAYVKKREMMQPAVFGSVQQLYKLAQQGIFTCEVMENLKNWSDISDIPVECLSDILDGRYDLAISRVAVQWLQLMQEQRFSLAYQMYYANWIGWVALGEKHEIMNACFEIYKDEMQKHIPVTEGIFKNVYSAENAINKYCRMKHG